MKSGVCLAKPTRVEGAADKELALNEVRELLGTICSFAEILANRIEALSVRIVGNVVCAEVRLLIRERTNPDAGRGGLAEMDGFAGNA